MSYDNLDDMPDEVPEGMAAFYYIFCNDADRHRVYNDFKARKLDFYLLMSEYSKKFAPTVQAAFYPPDKISYEYMSSRGRAKWEEWYRKFYYSSKDTKMIRLPMPHDKQKAMINGSAKYKVMVCGRRFGKTTAALIACILQANKKSAQVIYYIAPTYKQAKNIAWGMLNRYVGDCFSRKNEQELVIEFYNGSKIYLKGADNADSLRGAYVHLAILDEYADMRPDVWELIIRPMLLDTRGSAWFMGTPKGFDHFYDLWKSAFDGDSGPEWRAFRLTSFDNPYLDREELLKLKASMDERAFAQEIMAEFVQFEGLVYPDFKREEHVKAFDLRTIKGVDILGLDFGADHPTAGIFVRMGTDGKAYVWGEHYRGNLDAKEHANELKRIRGDRELRAIYLDPSAKQFGTELRRHGLPTRKAVNDREVGVLKLRSMLREGKVVVHPDCANLIYEFQHHVYKGVKKDGQDVGKNVKKVDDDALDALRYALASFYSGNPSGSDWKSPAIDQVNVGGVRTAPSLTNLNWKSPDMGPRTVAPEFAGL